MFGDIGRRGCYLSSISHHSQSLDRGRSHLVDADPPAVAIADPTAAPARRRRRSLLRVMTRSPSETRVSEGDLVITRSNDRRLRTLRGGWVRNGDRWRVAEVNKDGSARVERLGMGIGGGVTLPAAYVAEHVDLGYAVTAHRAQGLTVDTSHVVVSGSTTRENLYVSMTRGRDSNVAYVALDRPDDSHATPEDEEVTAKTVLYGVLQHSGAELSAHQTIEAEQERWSSIAQVAAEYETIAAVAQRDRWISLLEGCGLTDEQVEQVLASDSFGPLTAELRRAEANHHDVDRLLPKLVARRPLDDAEDVGAVLISRLQHETSRPKRGKRRVEAKLIAGLDPGRRRPDDRGDGRRAQRTAGPDRGAGARAGRNRRREWRTLAQASRRAAGRRVSSPALAARAPNRRRLPRPLPHRHRHCVGDDPRTDAQKLDAARAAQAIRRARAISEASSDRAPRSRAVRSSGPVIGSGAPQSWLRATYPQPRRSACAGVGGQEYQSSEPARRSDDAHPDVEPQRRRPRLPPLLHAHQHRDRPAPNPARTQMGGARRADGCACLPVRHERLRHLVERGGPGWLNVLVILFFWNAVKFTWMVLFSAIALAASVQRACRKRTSESGSTLRREDSVSEAPPDGVHQSERVKTVLVTDGPEGLGHLQGHEGLSRSVRSLRTRRAARSDSHLDRSAGPPPRPVSTLTHQPFTFRGDDLARQVGV